MTEQEAKVLNVLQYGKMITRKNLIRSTGICDRQLRVVLASLKRQGEWIVNFQYGGGYVRLKHNQKNLDTIMQYIKQEQSRAKKILESIKPMVQSVKRGVA